MSPTYRQMNHSYRLNRIIILVLVCRVLLVRRVLLAPPAPLDLPDLLVPPVLPDPLALPDPPVPPEALDPLDQPVPLV